LARVMERRRADKARTEPMGAQRFQNGSHTGERMQMVHCHQKGMFYNINKANNCNKQEEVEIDISLIVPYLYDYNVQYSDLLRFKGYNLTITAVIPLNFPFLKLSF
jgi:hypothetical protein